MGKLNGKTDMTIICHAIKNGSGCFAQPIICSEHCFVFDLPLKLNTHTARV